ncbi:ATP-dependent zinc protease family protein [Ekhidna sp.]
MQKKVIGGVDKVDLPHFNLYDIEAKIDTGANRSAIHCRDIVIIENNDSMELSFHIPLDNSKGDNVFQTQDFFEKKIRSSNGHSEKRYIIKTTVILFGRKIQTSFSLTDRTEMNYPILLGRKLLQSRFIVDVEEENLSFKAK